MYLPLPVILIVIGVLVGLVTFILGLFIGVYTGLGTGINANNKTLYTILNLLLGLGSWSALILVGLGVAIFFVSIFVQ